MCRSLNMEHRSLIARRHPPARKSSTRQRPENPWSLFLLGTSHTLNLLIKKFVARDISCASDDSDPMQVPTLDFGTNFETLGVWSTDKILLKRASVRNYEYICILYFGAQRTYVQWLLRSTLEANDYARLTFHRMQRCAQPGVLYCRS